MLLVLALLAATCAAIAAGFVWLFAVRPSWWPYWSALALALAVAGRGGRLRGPAPAARAGGARGGARARAGAPRQRRRGGDDARWSAARRRLRALRRRDEPLPLALPLAGRRAPLRVGLAAHARR